MFRREQGLLHNYVTSIVEAQDGSIWFGAAYGVSRYDGVNWTHYTEGNGLPGALVTLLMVDRKGRLWAASGDGFRGFRQGWLAYFEDGRWLPVILEGDRRNTLVGVLFELDGTVAIGTRGGGLFLEGEDGRLSRLGTDEGLNSNDVEAAAILPDGSALAILGLRGPRITAHSPSRWDPDGTWSSRAAQTLPVSM
ncbi:MAG: hypothetical protein CME26_13335 [Gemmatimonadetes bacterium]|nr:hypothetical protein [Gemmatimonadota bacterium]|tara:strand:+ start:1980 stop:2561 length:582 start_codon:yes stop_codon:yes gene_type:complete